MKKRHINIPIFIPHEGCPNSCVFCNQHTITQAENGGADRDVRPEIEACLLTADKNSECEIAFFGGSFTGIDRTQMIRLLETAYDYVKDGRVCSIRLSTRPDFISEEILDILGSYGVRHIELGIQSMSDDVLAASKRGHTAEKARDACRLIVSRGFSLTGQMMIGLPSSSVESEIMTAKEICELGADSARIYPTVVFYDTELCNMAKRKQYTPLTNDEAAKRCAAVYRVFAENGVTVLRVGLQSGEGLSEENVYAGASHSAIGEMAVSIFYFEEMRKICRKMTETGELCRGDRAVLTVFCAEGETSKVSGQKRVNKTRLTELFCELGVEICEIKVKELCDIAKNSVRITAQILKKRGE